MWWMCSSQCRLNIKMSSKYTTMNELVKGRKIFSFSLMKVVGELFNPKDMTIHYKRVSLDLNVVFHKSKGSIGTCL